jgi:hypothetical protein
MRRTLATFTSLVICLGATLGAVSAPAQAAPLPAKVTAQPYDALGDSFAAGVGLPSKSDAASAACGRSNLSYPKLLNGLPTLKKMDFVACTGATVADVLGDQLGAVDASTRTVTLTIGGNDVGFSGLTCLSANACDLGQLNAVAEAGLAQLGGTGPASLAVLLGAIRAKAPQADVFVTGYPELFGSSTKVFGTRTNCPVPSTSRDLVNYLTGRLNAVISGVVAEASSAGMKVTYVSVTKVFDGHGVCDSKAPFISTVLHPNVLGQAAYASVLIAKGVAS